MLANLAKILHDVMKPEDEDVFAPFDKLKTVKKLSKSCLTIKSEKLKKNKNGKIASKSVGHKLKKGKEKREVKKKNKKDKIMNYDPQDAPSVHISNVDDDSKIFRQINKNDSNKLHERKSAFV